jgi:thioesterase domain-containing protein
MKPIEFEDFLHTKIPLTKQMGLRISTFNQNEIIMTSPLAPNINDKGSVFGGSSSALQIICAWTLVKLNCMTHSIDADIVIHKNETVWNTPSYSDIKVSSKFVHSPSFDDIKCKLSLKNNVKLETLSTIMNQDNKICSEMKATYVLLAN